MHRMLVEHDRSASICDALELLELKGKPLSLGAPARAGGRNEVVVPDIASLQAAKRSVLMAKLATLAAALLLYSRSALAWGGLVHEAICELAFRELDDTARQRVIALIRQDEEFPTFRAFLQLSG
jgi:hypothetical protein